MYNSLNYNYFLNFRKKIILSCSYFKIHFLHYILEKTIVLKKNITRHNFIIYENI